MVESLNSVTSAKRSPGLTYLACFAVLTLSAGCATIDPWAPALSKRNMQFREVASFSSSAEIVKQIETGRLGGRFGGPATACTACSR